MGDKIGTRLVEQGGILLLEIGIGYCGITRDAVELQQPCANLFQRLQPIESAASAIKK